MHFKIITLGCKVNLYESEVIKENLTTSGFLSTEDESLADIIIINTCSVTNTADHKSLKMARHAHNLNKILVVCGCSSEFLKDTYQDLGIDILIGNKDKSKIPELIKEYLKTKKPITKFYNDLNLPFENMQVDKFTTHTRAFLKIQDGCNNYCSYCIIPYVRKNVRNKDFNKTLEEVKTLVKNGAKEIVLTGIHTGSYQDHDKYLKDVIHEISKFPDLKRIRISSIEVTELNDELLNEIKNNPKVVNHFHVPLQSGSNEILKKMNRKYDIAYFTKKINELRNTKEDVSITTDVIVGHPYETDKLFLETLKTCEDLNFSKIHVFPYSKKEGTASSRMPMQVDDVTKKLRSHKLNELSKTLEKNYYLKHLNTTLEVLIEQVKDNISTGTTSNYLKVKILKPLIHNNFYQVNIKSYQDGYLIGEIAYRQ